MEKRKHIRVVPFHNQPVQVQLMGNGFIDILIAQDLSQSGMAIRVPHHFDGCDINSAVELVVSLPGYKPFKAMGLIKHLAPAKEADGFFGVQFTQLDPKGKTFLGDFVKKLASQRRMAG
ncbi:PilZ domain-containing protein [Leptospira broomii]|nr:PilZ domain-containing protein [Leptospira broomii]